MKSFKHFYQELQEAPTTPTTNNSSSGNISGFTPATSTTSALATGNAKGNAKGKKKGDDVKQFMWNAITGKYDKDIEKMMSWKDANNIDARNVSSNVSDWQKDKLGIDSEDSKWNDEYETASSIWDWIPTPSNLWQQVPDFWPDLPDIPIPDMPEIPQRLKKNFDWHYRDHEETPSLLPIGVPMRPNPFKTPPNQMWPQPA